MAVVVVVVMPGTFCICARTTRAAPEWGLITIAHEPSQRGSSELGHATASRSSSPTKKLPSISRKSIASRCGADPLERRRRRRRLLLLSARLFSQPRRVHHRSRTWHRIGGFMADNNNNNNKSRRRRRKSRGSLAVPQEISTRHTQHDGPSRPGLGLFMDAISDPFNEPDGREIEWASYCFCRTVTAATWLLFRPVVTAQSATGSKEPVKSISFFFSFYFIDFFMAAAAAASFGLKTDRLIKRDSSGRMPLEASAAAASLPTGFKRRSNRS